MNGPPATAVAAWLLVKLAYVALGGHVAAQVAPVLLSRRDGHPALDAMALFIVVYGIILLWPIPILMALEDHHD